MLTLFLANTNSVTVINVITALLIGDRPLNCPVFAANAPISCRGRLGCLLGALLDYLLPPSIVIAASVTRLSIYKYEIVRKML